MIKNVFVLLTLFIFCCGNTEKLNDNQPLAGCTDSSAANYDHKATIDDGSCDYLGCTDSSAANYDSKATIDDGNCISLDDVPEGYALYWNDEFNGDSLNLSHWNIEVMPEGAVNNEAQAYTNSPENLYLSNGNLAIQARKDNPFNPNEPGYTSGRVNSRDKIEIEYGYVEIKAKLPSGVGTWPAIWLLSSDFESVGWPQCGEIDIMEHVGHDPNHVYFSLHNGTLFGNLYDTDQQGSKYSENIENAYHTYAVDWDSTYIRGYFDEVEFFQFSKTESMDFSKWPYDHPYFLILNLAIGGDWGGQQGIDNSAFPMEMEVDFVRVFKKSNNYRKQGYK